MRRDRSATGWLSDCEKCMQTVPQLHRQVLGCGYEPPLPAGMPHEVWDHEGRDGEPFTTCVGYTTKLPEVVEVSRARMHWSHGQLRESNDALDAALEILEIECNRVQAWLMTPAKDGGGGA